MTAATTVLFGFAPALHAVRGSLRGAMLEAGTGTTAWPGGRRTLSWLVTAEFAMAAILIVASGLLFGADQRVSQVYPAFGLYYVLPSWSRYPKRYTEATTMRTARSG